MLKGGEEAGTEKVIRKRKLKKVLRGNSYVIALAGDQVHKLHRAM